MTHSPDGDAAYAAPERGLQEDIQQPTIPTESPPSFPEGTTSEVALTNPAESVTVIGALSQEELPPERERDLLTVVGGYAVMGGYSAALIGLFTPGILTFFYCFLGEDLIGFIGFFILFFILGGFLWIPLSVVLAFLLGAGGLVLGLLVGIVAAILYRLTFDNPQALKAARIMVALLNGAMFGYLAVWLYSNTFIYDIYRELELVPYVLGLVGALSGVAVILIGPEKSDATESVTDEELEEAMNFFEAPFRLWHKVVDPINEASFGAVAAVTDQARAHSDPHDERFQKRQMERLMKKIEKEIKAAEKERK
jgi:hypothetical protein